MYKITRREAFSDTTFLWEVLAPDVAKSAEPGHFVMLRLHEGSERIPLTVADYDREKGTITLVIQALGKTTLDMRDHYKAGDAFADFVGPLGLPQHVSKVGHVVLVGGGLGVAPVYPQLRAFKEAGNRTTGIIGFRNKDLVFWEEAFGEYCDELIVCTDDGSYGKPGFVTAALNEVLEQDKPDLVIAIGPLPMMNACVETSRPFGVKTMVSLNAIMVDGTGMCGSCRVDGRRRSQVRLRRRPGLRRPSGRLQGADAAPEALQAARSRARARITPMCATSRRCCSNRTSATTRSSRSWRRTPPRCPSATR